MYFMFICQFFQCFYHHLRLLLLINKSPSNDKRAFQTLTKGEQPRGVAGTQPR